MPTWACGGVGSGLGRGEHLFGALEGDARGDLALVEGALAVVVDARLGELAVGGRQARLSGAQAVLLVGRVESGDQLAGLDGVADVDQPLGYAAADAEGEVDLHLALDRAGERTVLPPSRSSTVTTRTGRISAGARLVLGVAGGEQAGQEGGKNNAGGPPS